MKNNITKSSKIDILIPCYNSAETIRRTLKSISFQSYSDYRVILVDNNSVDNSVEIFNNFNDERFECVCYDETTSLGGNFNRCLELVTSDYFCIMHCDDEYEIDYLSTMMRVMEDNKDIELAVCNANIINSISEKVFSLKNLIKRKSFFSKNIKYSGIGGVVWISDYNKIIAPSAFYRKSILSKIGQFNPQLKFTLDWEYYFRLLSMGGSILYVNNTLFNYRIHGNQQTAALIVSMEKYQEMYSLLTAMDSYISPKKQRKIWKYKYFIFTIAYDFMSDIIHMRIMQGFRKVRFCIKLFYKDKERV
jgi:glycosyltransferase involved in cell wall biosynthesis